MHPDLKAHIEGDLAQFGFSTLAAKEPEGWIAHTVGLTELGHPEILISGMHGQLCHMVFQKAYHAIKAGQHFKAGETDDTLGALTCAFKPLSLAAAEQFCWRVQEFYAGTTKTPTFLQLVLPDKQGNLPWQPGYDTSMTKFQRHLWVQLH